MKLIKLKDKFILVSDEKGKEGRNFNFALNNIDVLSRDYEEHSSEWNFCRKIISENPDFSDLKEEECIEIGYVDIERLANVQWGNVHRTGVLGFIEGFKKAQELNTKLFSLEDMINAYRKGTNSGVLYESLCDHDSHDCEEADEFAKSEYDEFIQSLQQTEWDVEVEMEEDTTNLCDCYYTKFCKSTQLENGIKCRDEKHFRPKITNGKIKVIKIL